MTHSEEVRALIPDGSGEVDLHPPLGTQDGLEVGRPGGVAEPAGAAVELVGTLGGRQRGELAVEVDIELVAVGGGEDDRAGDAAEAVEGEVLRAGEPAEVGGLTH